jgi:putative PLP-dependent aminotransferase (TIGR04422 family)
VFTFMGFWRKDRSEQLVPLWPRSFIPKKLSWATNTSLLGWFTKNFTNGYPVLVSSGRSGISILSKLFAVNEFSLFPFANSCVIQAISHSSSLSLRTNLTNSSDVAGHNIIYHQWGYTDVSAPSEPFIEDRVDTFYKIDSSVRHLNGRFEIWSLSKILGIRTGAVIWCKNKDDQDVILNYISKQNKLIPYWKYLLKTLADFYPTKFYIKWEKSELSNSRLSSLDLFEIAYSLKKWGERYSQRRRSIIEFVNQHSAYFETSEIQYLFKSIDDGVLPSGLILGNLLPDNSIVPSIRLHKFNYSSVNVGKLDIKVVSFIPTHLL